MSYRREFRTFEGPVVTGLIYNLTDETVAKAMKATCSCRVEVDEILEVQDEDIVESIDISLPRIFVSLGRTSAGPQ